MAIKIKKTKGTKNFIIQQNLQFKDSRSKVFRSKSTWKWDKPSKKKRYWSEVDSIKEHHTEHIIKNNNSTI